MGLELLESMDNLSHEDVWKSSLKVKPLAILTKKVKVGDKQVFIRNTTCFARLSLLSQREEDVDSAFVYELTPVPLSIFTDAGLMRKADKAAFGKQLKEGIIFKDEIDGQLQFVVDGGWLLHQVRPWTIGMTWEEVARMYTVYVCSNFGTNTLVVFDGYMTVPSTKDHEHSQRYEQVKCADITINPSFSTKVTKDKLLSNMSNKKQLLALIAHALEARGMSVQTAVEDADTLIVKSALEKDNLTTYDDEVTVVVAEDTDILVLLCHHCRSDNVYLKTAQGYLRIKDVRAQIDQHLLNILLFAYAWTGCDTTSTVFGKGKVTSMKNCMKLPSTTTSLFSNRDTGVDVIKAAGISIMTEMCGGGDDVTLGKLRYRAYNKQVLTGKLSPERLPPTKGAVEQHALRVHAQICDWIALVTQDVDPIGRGWELQEASNTLIPVMTNMQMAPDGLIKTVFCNCKFGERQCMSNICSCRKNGLKCISACGICEGKECCNSNVYSREMDNEGSESEFDTEEHDSDIN